MQPGTAAGLDGGVKHVLTASQHVVRTATFSDTRPPANPAEFPNCIQVCRHLPSMRSRVSASACSTATADVERACLVGADLLC